MMDLFSHSHGEVRDTWIQHLDGGEFESIISTRLTRLKKEGLASVSRPGVFANVIKRYEDGTVHARLIQSMPDYQGVFGTPQREVIFDAKVCSQASFCLAKFRTGASEAKTRQLRFMYERSKFGSTCFFLLHWNRRELKTKTDDAETYAFPVADDHPFWELFERGEIKSISRSHCEEYATKVRWTVIGEERIPRPDLMSAFNELSGTRPSNVARSLKVR